MSGDLSDREIEVFTKRVGAMVGFGLDEQEAEVLAERLLNRDRDPSDDRKVCFACDHLRHGVQCKALRFEPVRTVLWRCDYFKAKK